MATATETPAEALARIQSGYSKNDAAAIAACAARGIDPADVEPRVNVLTFRAWRAKGRHVRKGEKAIRLAIWRPITKTRADGTTENSVMPWTAHVFHISQTDPDD